MILHKKQQMKSQVERIEKAYQDKIANYEKPYSGFAFLEEIKAILDKEQPDYKN